MANSALTRIETIAIVEAYFDAFLSEGLKTPPITRDYAASSPLAGKLQAPDALKYFQLAGSNIETIELHEHIVEGDRVVTLLTEYTPRGEIEVIALFTMKGNLVRRADVYYDVRSLERS